MSEYQLNPMNEFCNDETSKILKNRISNMDIQERLKAASMSQMFSFWHEIQDCLIAADQEIERLRKEKRGEA